MSIKLIVKITTTTKTILVQFSSKTLTPLKLGLAETYNQDIILN